MEIRVIGRGALAGFIAGLLGFVFARIFAEPIISRAIDYESQRDHILDALRQAAGQTVDAGHGHEEVSRSLQATLGIGTGIVALATAMGALVAVAYLLLREHVDVSARTLAWQIAGFGFLAVFLLPFVKYPANPPAIGHDFTIHTRGSLYLGMVAVSFALLGLAVFAAYRLTPRFGALRAVLFGGAGFLVLFGIALALFPSLGDLSANVNAAHDLGFATGSTETPQAVTNTFTKTLTIDGKSYAPGQIVFPGFSADDLWRFRWNSIIEQVILWGGIALIFGGLMQRLLEPKSRTAPVVENTDVARDTEATV